MVARACARKAVAVATVNPRQASVAEVVVPPCPGGAYWPGGPPRRNASSRTPNPTEALTDARPASAPALPAGVARAMQTLASSRRRNGQL